MVDVKAVDSHLVDQMQMCSYKDRIKLVLPTKVQNVHMQSVTTTMYTNLVPATFYTMLRGKPSGDALCKNLAMECKPGRTQLTLLTRRFGLALTRGGSLGEGGALRRSLFAHSLQYSRAVGRRSTDTALTSLGA